jgi:hypothetical protein
VGVSGGDRRTETAPEEDLVDHCEGGECICGEDCSGSGAGAAIGVLQCREVAMSPLYKGHGLRCSSRAPKLPRRTIRAGAEVTSADLTTPRQVVFATLLISDS